MFFGRAVLHGFKPMVVALAVSFPLHSGLAFSEEQVAQLEAPVDHLLWKKRAWSWGFPAVMPFVVAGGSGVLITSLFAVGIGRLVAVAGAGIITLPMIAAMPFLMAMGGVEPNQKPRFMTAGNLALGTCALAYYGVFHVSRTYGLGKVAGIEFCDYSTKIQEGISGQEILGVLKRDDVRPDVMHHGKSLYSLAIQAKNWDVLEALLSITPDRYIKNDVIPKIFFYQVEDASETLAEIMKRKITDDVAQKVGENTTTPARERSMSDMPSL